MKWEELQLCTPFNVPMGDTCRRNGACACERSGKGVYRAANAQRSGQCTYKLEHGRLGTAYLEERHQQRAPLLYTTGGLVHVCGCSLWTAADSPSSVRWGTPRPSTPTCRCNCCHRLCRPAASVFPGRTCGVVGGCAAVAVNPPPPGVAGRGTRSPTAHVGSGA